jgi:hypothetical protein
MSLDNVVFAPRFACSILTKVLIWDPGCVRTDAFYTGIPPIGPGSAYLLPAFARITISLSIDILDIARTAVRARLSIH